MELIFLGLFSLVLFVSIIFNFSLIAALLIGLAIFLTYALLRGFSLSEILRMVSEGIIKAKNIPLTFILIGMMTALWRAAGTIPAIVCTSSAYSGIFEKTGMLNGMQDSINRLAKHTNGFTATVCTFRIHCFLHSDTFSDWFQSEASSTFSVK